MDDYLESLDSAGLRSAVTEEACEEKFKFGDGKLVVARKVYFVPGVVANTPLTLKIFVIDGIDLPLLLGRDFAGDNGVAMDFLRNRLIIDGLF